MRDWNGDRGCLNHWLGSSGVSNSPLDNLSFPFHRLRRLPRISMGHPAFGDRLSRDLYCAVENPAGLAWRSTSVADRSVATALAAVPANVRIGLRQTPQPRSRLAQFDSPQLSLRNTTA